MPARQLTLGFTLIEILVALLILAVIATVGVLGLNVMVTSDARQATITDELAELQFAYLMIQHDLAQIIHRPIIDSMHQQRPAFLGVTAKVTSPFDVAIQGQLILDFTRDGVLNPQQLAGQSGLQRVTYSYHAAGKLRRYSWLALDRVPGSLFFEHVLLTKITNLQLTYFDCYGQPFNQWMTAVIRKSDGFSNLQPMDNLPAAVEWRFQHPRYGQIIWLFLTPGADDGAPILTQ